MAQTPNQIIALDVGNKRIGVAVASVQARVARPLTTLLNDETFIDKISTIIDREAVGAIVVGLPRGLEGQSTDQTRITEQFVESLKQVINLPIKLQDEALSSQQAEEQLDARKSPYSKADIDALAASYILEYFLTDHPRLNDFAEFDT